RRRPRPAVTSRPPDEGSPAPLRWPAHPPLPYPLGCPLDALSSPVSRDTWPGGADVLSTHRAHSPPAAGLPTPGRGVPSKQKCDFHATIVSSIGLAFRTSHQGYGLLGTAHRSFGLPEPPSGPSRRGN